MLEALEASLANVTVAPPSLTVVSNLTGEVVGRGEMLDGGYWKRHAREAVAFARGVGTLAGLGVDLVIEIGPRTVLGPMALSAWPESVGTPVPAVLSSMRPAEGAVGGSAQAAGDGDGFVEAVARGYEAGLPIRVR